MSDDTPIFPAQVEAKILEISNRLGKSAKVCDERYRAYLDAELEFEKARAVSEEAAEGSIQSKKNQALIETYELKKALNVAESAWKYADRLARNLAHELSAYQSVGQLVKATYGAAGVGER